MCKLRQFNEDENNGPCQLGEGLLCYNGLALQEWVGRSLQDDYIQQFSRQAAVSGPLIACTFVAASF